MQQNAMKPQGCPDDLSPQMRPGSSPSPRLRCAGRSSATSARLAVLFGLARQSTAWTTNNGRHIDISQSTINDRSVNCDWYPGRLLNSMTAVARNREARRRSAGVSSLAEFRAHPA